MLAETSAGSAAGRHRDRCWPLRSSLTRRLTHWVILPDDSRILHGFAKRRPSLCNLLQMRPTFFRARAGGSDSVPVCCYTRCFDVRFFLNLLEKDMHRYPAVTGPISTTAMSLAIK